MVKHLTPLMRQALRDCKQLWYAAELWLSVLNKSIDSLADFQLSTSQVNIDFTSYEGSSRLAIIPSSLVIEQASHDTSLDMYDAPGVPWTFVGKFVWQGFPLDTPRQLNAVTVRVDATGAGASSWIQGYIVSGLVHWAGSDGTYGANYTVHTSFKFPFTDGLVGNVRVELPDAPLLPKGDYWLMCVSDQGVQVALRYVAAGAYAGGSLEYQNAYSQGGVLYYRDALVTLPAADLLFKLEFSAYATQGSYTTKVLDLGAIPTQPGEFQMATSIPDGCGLSIDLHGSNNPDMSSPVSYVDIQDGAAISAQRFWNMDVRQSTNVTRDATSELDRAEVLFPDRIRYFRQLGRALRNVASDILDMEPILEPGEYKASELKVLERISSIGEFTVTLKSADRDAVQTLASDSPLKNYRMRLFLGADVPGLKRSDLFRYFSGIVKAPKLKPKFERNVYGLSLTVNNPMMELKRKIPAPNATGLVELGDLAINRDRVHVCDSMVEDIRGEARVPARFVDLESFRNAKTTVGGGTLAASMFVIRRSNAAGLPDTRIQSPEELRKLLEPQAFIADGYIVMDELSRLQLILHDAAAAHEETWADYDLVKAGLNAVPIYDMAEVDLMYEEWLYNVVICGCAWNGTGSKWDAFSKKYAYADGDSINEFGMGEAEHQSIFEKPMLEVSKYLGPEAGYGGETLSAYIATKLGQRYAFPPAVIKGAVVPVSQLERGPGAVVRVISREFTTLGRRGIGPVEVKKFMLMCPKYNQNKNRMTTDLFELT